MLGPVERADFFIGRPIAGTRDLENALSDASACTQPAVGTGDAAGQQGVEHGPFVIDDVGDHGQQDVVVLTVEKAIGIGAGHSFGGIGDPIERGFRWRCFFGIGMGCFCGDLASKDFLDLL